MSTGGGVTGKAAVKRGPARLKAKSERAVQPPRKLRTAASAEQLAALRDELAQDEKGPCEEG